MSRLRPSLRSPTGKNFGYGKGNRRSSPPSTGLHRIPLFIIPHILHKSSGSGLIILSFLPLTHFPLVDSPAEITPARALLLFKGWVVFLLAQKSPPLLPMTGSTGPVPFGYAEGNKFALLHRPLVCLIIRPGRQGRGIRSLIRRWAAK